MGTGLCLPLLGQSPATLQRHDTVTARKDDVSAADQAAMANVAG